MLRGKGSGELSWFLQAQQFCFRASQSDCSSTISCDITSCCEATLYKVSCLGLAVANQNAALRFCIQLRSNVQPARDRLHNIAVKSRACTTKKLSNVTRPFPARGLGVGNKTIFGISLNHQIYSFRVWCGWGFN